MKYFKNTSWLFAEKILRMIVGLFVGIWVARYLGPEQFGLLSYSISFVGLFTAISTLGLDGIVIRELVKDDSKRDVLLGTAFILKLMGAFCVLLFLAIAVNFTSNDHYTNMLIFIIASATIFQSLNVIDFYFQSKVLSKYVVYANVISLFISTIIKIILLLNEASVIAFAWVVVFDSFVLAMGFLYFYLHNHLSLRSWKFEKNMTILLLKDSSPLIIAGVINSIQMKIDQTMIKEILNVTEVGYYAVAAQLSTVWFGIGVIICNSLFPAIINAKKVSEKFYYTRIQKLFLFLTAISYILAISVYFLADLIILTLYGKEFIAASSVLSIHIFSVIFVYLGVSSGRWLINENRSMLNFYRNLLGLIINIVLNIFFIKKYGIVGAAYASLIAFIIAFYVFDVFLMETRKIFILKSKSLLLIRENNEK
ncbi:flippase [Sulfurovum sp. AR]|uniref:flippase n=1 Tax=Sulfurovum sp. AR TaxID=1165841 RepID=UPI00025C4EBF|nr:flippase [Sulfurovum sp. AR]EIF50101.1 polysaccharide biosynthesis protein [Sulfurovum sp. AR]